MFGKRKVATLVAEFLGTGVLTLLILSVQRTQLGIPLFVGLTAGLGLMVMTFAAGRTSGAHFNPAITIGMWTTRKIPTITAGLYIVMQLLGALGAYYLYRYFVTDNAAILNSLKQQAGGHYNTRVLISEAVGTSIFAFAWVSTVYQRFTPAMTAAVAGLAYTAGIIVAGSASLGLLNPAVALGAHAWSWGTYALGPVLGAVIGVNLYSLLFAESEVATASAAAASVSAPAAKKSAVKKPVARKKTTRAKK